MTAAIEANAARVALVAQVLPGFVSQVEALARRVAVGEAVSVADWEQVRTLEALAVSRALARLERLDRAAAVAALDQAPAMAVAGAAAA